MGHLIALEIDRWFLSLVTEACHKCSSDNICSYKEGFSQDVILSTDQLHLALQVLKGQVARKPSALCVLWPKGGESRAGVSRWLGTAVPCHGQRGDILVPALCLPDWIPALSHIHPTPVGWGWGSFVSPFCLSPAPFPLLGFVFEGKRQAPSVPAAAAVHLFGQAESKARSRWFSGRHLFVLTMRVTNCFLLAVSFR